MRELEISGSLFKLLVDLSLPYTVALLPVVLFPLMLLTAGVAWFLASLGVYLRDISQTIGILTTALLFLSPIFYPASALPPDLQAFFLLNPLTFIIEQTRGVLIMGKLPSWGGLGLYCIVGLLSAGIGLVWFQKTRKGFADVL